MKPGQKKLAIIVVAALLLAAGYFALSSSKTNDHPEMDMTETPATQETTPDAATDTEPTGKTVEVTMEAGNYYFSPKTISAKQGDTVKITLTAKGMMHNFMIDELGVASANVQPGNSTTITFTASKVGTFTYYCSIGSHRQLGQEGTLTVE